jgi:hypothetical protein
MNLGSGQKHMNPSFFAGGFDCFTGRINVFRHATGESGDDGTFDFFGDCLNRCEIAITDHRETGLDHIHLQACQLARHFELLTQIHGSSGALLAVAQGGVKDEDAIILHVFLSIVCSSCNDKTRRRKRKTPLPG